MSSEDASFDLTGFLWCIFAANMAYPVLACLQGRLFVYPAKRHRSDPYSVAFIGCHICASGLVIWGGCAVWLAVQLRYAVPNGVYQAIACAGLAHVASNVVLLRKIPGIRAINVPIYVMITVYNGYRSSLLIEHHDKRDFLLLWCSMTTFVFVRYYLAAFFIMTYSTHDVTEVRTYETLYTACLPYAGVWGVIIPAVSLGADPRWLCLYGAVAVLGPMMIALHQASVMLERKLLCQSGLLVSILLVPLSFLKASTDLLEYHDRKALPVTVFHDTSDRLANTG